MTETVRTRSLTTVPVDANSIWQYRQPPGSGAWNNDPVIVLKSWHENAMTDTVTDRYLERISLGQIINSPCIKVDETTSTSTGIIEYLQLSPLSENRAAGEGSFTMRSKTDWPSGISTDDLFDYSDLIEVAKQRALSKIDSTPYSFAEDLGEVRETLRFLKQPLGGILNLARKFRVGAFRKGRRLYGTSRAPDKAKAIADAYLEFRFAASPLYRSAMSLVEAMHDHIKVPLRRTSHGLEENEQELVNDSAPGQLYYLYDYQKMHSVVIRANILYEVTNPLSGIGFKYGLRLKDIPRTLWDLVPLSFMVDRVVDIGRNISGLVNFLDPRVSILAASVVIKNDVFYKIAISDMLHPNYQMTSCDKNDYVFVHKFSYDRTVWEPTAADLGPLVDTRPLVRDITSIADLTSLIVSNLVGK